MSVQADIERAIVLEEEIRVRVEERLKLSDPKDKPHSDSNYGKPKYITDKWPQNRIGVSESGGFAEALG